MKLYLVHCGFYDQDIADGVYESHTNFFVVAENFDDARAKAKLDTKFRDMKMHVDGLQEIRVVGGFRIEAHADEAFEGKSMVVSSRHRDLAAKTASGALL